MDKEYYVLRYPTGGFVAIDGNSGGYPYESTAMHSIQFWDKAIYALDYKKYFPDLNLRLCLVSINVTEMSEDPDLL